MHRFFSSCAAESCAGMGSRRTANSSQGYSGTVIKLQSQTAKGKDVKVRYIGVDAPDKGKPFFEICRNANKALVENRKVRVQSDAAC